MDDWSEIREWRRAKRRELIARRAALTPARRSVAANSIVGRLMDDFPILMESTLGFYWPFKGEVNLRPFVAGCLEIAAQAALPVVVERSRPLEFWRWSEGAPLKSGLWDIPVPADRDPLQPAILLVPLVGFDGRGYRLGHGGGYYDRTLASMKQRPTTIGIGYGFQRLPTIHPRPHDIPMDHIVTEEGHFRRPTRPRTAARLAPADRAIH